MNADKILSLTPLQYHVTQECGTEPPFQNEYWNHKADGIYVDIVSGEPLFSSLNKFNSGTGWPSFDRPIQPKAVSRNEDTSHGMLRIEVKSTIGDSHLGHVFPDGPAETTGERYCINSAALRFVPLEKLRSEGLGQYLFEFASKKGWEIATLAGGCFWGMEDLFSKLEGIIETQVGYTGGVLDSPRYEDIKTGRTGHAEALQVLFEPQQISYKQLIQYFFRIHDPTTLHRQGNDRGSQYRSCIFFSSSQQEEVARQVIAEESQGEKCLWQAPIVTEVVPLQRFWRAEDFHQKYLLKNPGGYTCHFERT